MTFTTYVNSSADAMTSRYSASRQSRVTVFDNLRNEHPDLKLHTQCGQVFDKDIHMLDILSFATPTCVRNCLREPRNDVGDMVDLSIIKSAIHFVLCYKMGEQSAKQSKYNVGVVV